MSGMDRLTDERLDAWSNWLEWDDKHSAGDSFDSEETHELLLMARELLAHRRAKRSITNCDFYLKGSKYENGPYSIATFDPSGATHFDMDDLVIMSRSEYSRRASQAAPAPSDGLREEASAVLAGLGPVHGKLMYERYEGSANAVMNAADWIIAALSAPAQEGGE